MIDYDPFMDEVLEDPYPVYRRLRDESPVHYLERWNAWALSRFEDIWTASQDSEHLTSTRGTSAPQLLSKVLPPFPNLSHMDPPDHTRLRTDLRRHFMPRRVRGLEPVIRDYAREALDAVRDAGHCDAVADLGQRVAVRVACTAIGFPPRDAARIVDMVARFFARDEGVVGMSPAGMKAFAEIQDYLQELTRSRRAMASPPDDPLTTLLRHEIAGERLDDEGMGNHATLLLIGATETFPKVFASAVRRLAEHPEQRELLRADPGLIPDGFRELLRYDMPTQFLARTVVRPFELGGQRLEPDQVVMFLYPSGTRDEREFVEPDVLDVRRRPPRILSFGHGAHRCLGAHFAEMEGRILLEELLAAIPAYDVHPGRAQRERTEFVQGFTSLPISW